MATKRFILSLLVMFLVGTTLVSAQKTRVTGEVTEAGMGPIAGVTVILQGSSTGTVTGFDGKYSLDVTKEGVLEFRFLGMETLIEPVKGRAVINVEMKNDAITMDEVVVVGYGTQTKRTVTASVASVKGDSFKDMPSPSAETALQGRAAGVSIITTSGAVGQAPIVRVRGVSSITSGTEPLYVVDGVPVQTGNVSYTGSINPLADINPADILSMDVLKDAAAAAMYGSRAANGVVLITTKKGQQEKAKISYNTWVGVTVPSKTVDVMNAQQYVDFKNLTVKNRYGTDERSLTSGYTSPYGYKAYNMWKLTDGSYVDTDWSKEVFQTGLQHSHAVSISGGTQRIQYYLSANYTDQSGVIKNDNYNRLGGAANVTAKATDWLKIGFNMNATNSGTKYSDKGRNGGVFATEGYTRLALILPPNMPAYNEDGTAYLGDGGAMGIAPNTVRVSGYPNPAALLENGSQVETDVARILSSYFAELTPIKNLTLKTQLGIDYMNVVDKRFNNPYMGDGYSTHGEAYSVQIKNKTLTWTNTAQYNFSLGDHNFDVLAGMESYEKKRDRWGAYRTDIADTKFQLYQADFSNTYPYGNEIVESSLLSYLGRINYDYMAKYMLSLNFRRDGYSALSKNHRWGNFGGASAAWRISQEEFFKPFSNVVTDLKVKGSWGIVGNTNVKEYASKSYYTSGYYGTSGVYKLSSIADSENLKWESSSKMDLGFSAQLFNNLTVEFDYYKNIASDLILDVPVSPSKGIPDNKITTNAGKMTNSGIELTLSAQVVKADDFTWNTSFNITTSKNRVNELAEGVSSLIGGSGSNESNITLPGYSIGQLYVTPTAGIDPETGRRIFIGGDGTEVLMMFEKSGKYFRKDNGEAYMESDIKKIIAGGTLPTYYGGWSNDFKYKNFDLSLLFQYSGGNKIYNGTTATLSDMRFWNNAMDVYNNYWKASGDAAKYAKPIYGDNYSNGSAFPISQWVEKGDYLRMKNISFGYTFDTKKWSKKIGISALRVYAQAQNLFVITSYSGLDPEALVTTDNAILQGGVDKNTMPNSKVYTFGANITF